MSEDPIWGRCRIGSCHRHQECMYSPCRASSVPAADTPTCAPPAGTADGLLRCPFCGGKADPEGWYGKDASGPSCEECEATAISAADWNRRILPDEIAALRAERDALHNEAAKWRDEASALLARAMKAELAAAQKALSHE